VQAQHVPHYPNGQQIEFIRGFPLHGNGNFHPPMLSSDWVRSYLREQHPRVLHVLNHRGPHLFDRFPGRECNIRNTSAIIIKDIKSPPVVNGSNLGDAVCRLAYRMVIIEDDNSHGSATRVLKA
jgi:hypothetical protein